MHNNSKKYLREYLPIYFDLITTSNKEHFKTAASIQTNATPVNVPVSTLTVNVRKKDGKTVLLHASLHPGCVMDGRTAMTDRMRRNVFVLRIIYNAAGVIREELAMETSTITCINVSHWPNMEMG